MNIFNAVKQTRVKKSMFDLSHDVKLSCNMGELIPVLTMPVIPGDHVQLSGETLIRLAPVLAPLMHRIDATIHYFFCPNRILWGNWEKFITGSELFPGSVTAVPVLPQYDVQSASGQDPAFQRLADYMGVPPTASIGYTVTSLTTPVSALPFAAYGRIWFEYYRDQNQILPGTYPTLLSDGVQVIDLGTVKLHNRAWEHDYFTSALPWAQKGANVEIPMSLTTGLGGSIGTTVTASDGTNITGTQGAAYINTAPNSQFGALFNATTSKGMQIHAGTINDLRKAYKLQEWLEKNARGGTRYKESLIAHWNVNSSDKRLQRPEYITGLKTPVIITEILNTTGPIQGTTGTQQGTMTGHGTAFNKGQAGTYFVEEHGYIMGILSVLPKTAYQQGIPKDFFKTDYLDFGFPEFAHLGEQPILEKEIGAYTTTDPNIFGYTPRYAEYKFMLNRVCGDFRTSLNYWHMGRIFAAPPGLNQAFIESDPTTRIFSVTDPTVQHLWIQVVHHIKALRPLPKFGTPGW